MVNIGGHIDFYTDLNSIYGYFGFVHLLKHLEALGSHGVEVDFHPVYLPDLQQRSGNRVIWTVDARQAWLEKYELPRSKRDFGVIEANPPDGDLNNLFKVGQTQLPLRALLAIKKIYPTEVYNATWHWLYRCFWTPPQQRIKDEAPLRNALTAMPRPFRGSIQDKTQQFSMEEVDNIIALAKEQEIKDELRKNTNDALRQGAFGAPWMMVRNSAGMGEPFFGSDRFSQVYEFLGLPYTPLQLLPSPNSVKSKL
ncbi:putative dsba-like thioredoxin domain-containing protein [Rosellinia necatrix]|uniref:Putative dsba-like thioredoxin domain-containing protein n=1 Tax=Rosellinia necatrix TaxID=77044 RepID=A0A1S7UHY0_ROSNE|nr:putative dsba-like thioredoxin domain-containing protein [Rosellinia necatrix]